MFLGTKDDMRPTFEWEVEPTVWRERLFCPWRRWFWEETIYPHPDDPEFQLPDWPYHPDTGWGGSPQGYFFSTTLRGGWKKALRIGEKEENTARNRCGSYYHPSSGNRY